MVGDVMKGAIQATNEVGTELASTAKGAVIGVIRGSGEISTVSVGVLSDTVRPPSRVPGRSAATSAPCPGRGRRRDGDHARAWGSGPKTWRSAWPAAAIQGTREAGADLEEPQRHHERHRHGTQEVGGNVLEAIEDTARGLINGASEVGGDVASVTRNAVEGAIEATGSITVRVQDAAFSAARGTIHGSREVGGELAGTARDAINGTVTGTQQVGGNVLQAIEDSTRGLIKGTAEVGGDVGSVARNAVEEAIDSAKSIGLRAEDAASAAANGAMSAAGSFGETTVNTVTGAVSGTVSGVRVVVKAPFGSPKKRTVNFNLESPNGDRHTLGYSLSVAVRIPGRQLWYGLSAPLISRFHGPVSYLRAKEERVKDRLLEIPVFVLATRTIRELSDDDATHMAAGVAYYAILSLFPMTVGSSPC